MSSLLLVGAMGDLPRACREAGELLAIQYRRREHNPSDPAVLGIWIEARPTQALSVSLSFRDRSGACRVFPVRESAGMPGVWKMLWLEVPDGTGPDEARHFIVQMLIESSMPGDTSGRFAPVFAANAAAEAVRAELRRLQERFPGRLVPPVLQDPDTGRLSPPAASTGAVLD